MTELTPHALAQTRRWATLLATDDDGSRVASVRGLQHARLPARRGPVAGRRRPRPGLNHEMVCILLAIYVIDVASVTDGEFGGAFVPRDAA